MKVKQIFIVLILISSCTKQSEYALLEARLLELEVTNNETVYALGSNSCRSCKSIYLSYIETNNINCLVAVDTFKTVAAFDRTRIVHDKNEILSRIYLDGYGDQRKIVLKDGKIVEVTNITMQNYMKVVR